MSEKKLPADLGNYKKLITKNFLIIFDQSLQPTKVQKFANIIEHSYQLQTTFSSHFYKNPRIKRKKIAILNYKEISGNAAVSVHSLQSYWSPVGSSFVAMFGNSWLYGIAIHETRHMMQAQAFKNTPLYKGIFPFFGTHGAHFLQGFGLPFWFNEGDAIFSESFFPLISRPVQADFFQKYQTIVSRSRTSKRSYYSDVTKSQTSNHKNWNIFPNYYELGYLMMSYLTSQISTEKMKKIISDIYHFPLPFAFEFSVLRHSGKHVYQHYQSMLQTIETFWNDSKRSIADIDTQLIKHHKGIWNWSYSALKIMDGGNILAQKCAPFRSKKIVLLQKDGKETIFLTLPKGVDQSLGNNNISVGTYLVGYVEIILSRWDGIQKSQIVLQNWKTKKKKIIIPSAQVVEISLSPNDKLLAISQMTHEGKFLFQIMDIEQQTVHTTLLHSESHLVTQIVWSPDSSSVVYIKNPDLQDLLSIPKYEIVLHNIQSLNSRTVLQSIWPVRPLHITHQKKLLFSGGASKEEGIFCLSLLKDHSTVNPKILRIVGAEQGVINLSTGVLSADNRILFTKFDNQFRAGIYSVPSNQLHWTEVSEQFFQDFSWGQSPTGAQIQIGNPQIFEPLPSTVYPISDYKTTLPMIFSNPEWSISYMPADDDTPPNKFRSHARSIEKMISLEFNTSDPFNSIQIFSALKYNLSRNNLSEEIKIKYSGSYPVISFSIKNINKQLDSIKDGYNKSDTNQFLYFPLGELLLSNEISIPVVYYLARIRGDFDFSTGVFYKFLYNNPSTSFYNEIYRVPSHSDITMSFRILQQLTFPGFGDRQIFLLFLLHSEISLKNMASVQMTQSNFNDHQKEILLETGDFFNLDTSLQKTLYRFSLKNKESIFTSPKIDFLIPGFYLEDIFSVSIFYGQYFEKIATFSQNFPEKILIAAGEISYKAPLFQNWAIGPLLALRCLHIETKILGRMQKKIAYDYHPPNNQTLPTNVGGETRSDLTSSVSFKQEFSLFPAIKNQPQLSLSLTVDTSVESIQSPTSRRTTWKGFRHYISVEIVFGAIRLSKKSILTART